MRPVVPARGRGGRDIGGTGSVWQRPRGMTGREAPCDAGPGAPVLELRDLSVDHPVRHGLRLRRLRAVAGVSLRLPPGHALSVLGAAGSGKSSLARALLRPGPAGGGVVRHGPAEAGEGRMAIQAVPQDPDTETCPRMSLGANLAEPLARREGLDGAAIGARVAEALALVGLPGALAERLPHTLSAEERWRGAVALALIARPRLLVLDEPLAGLDHAGREALLGLLVALRRDRGIGLLVLTRHAALAGRLGQEIAVLHHGRIVEQGPARALLAAPRHPATRQLLEGRPPGTGAAPPATGCDCQGWCPAATALCRTERPVLHGHGGHWTACHHAWGGAPPVPRPERRDAA